MIKRTVINANRWVTLANQNKFFLLEHKYVEKTKKKMFEHNEKTLWLKLKFIVKEAKYTIVQGSKDLWQDLTWMVALCRKKKFSHFTGYERYLTWRITTDILKFVPYSVLVLIPLAEALIPVVVWLFPNAVPSFFLFDTA